MSWPGDRWPTSKEILERLRELAAVPQYKANCSVADLPNVTSGGRTSNFVRIGLLDAGSPKRNKVVITAGVHAREWTPPAAVTNLIPVILDASLKKTSITIGSGGRSDDDVKAIIQNVDLFIAPMINPDGYDFSLTPPIVPPGWRKNRRPAPAPPPGGFPCDPADAIGVDVNRNFDVLWDFEKFYLPGSGVSASKDPCVENFIGSPDAFSEPESRNVRSLLEKDPEFYVDVHMFGRNVFHSWGVEINQPISGATPPLNPGRVRDGKLNAGYSEPIDKDFLGQISSLANLMADATGLASPGKPYGVLPGALDTVISGASDDFAFSRNLGNGKTLAKAFTLECGTSFLPDFKTEFVGVEREIHAALLALLRRAAAPRGASKPSSCNSCSIADEH